MRLVPLLELTLVNSLDIPESIAIRRPEDLLRSWINGPTSAETVILVAESAGQMTGFVVATFEQHTDEETGYQIHYLGVAEPHRRLGWATRLLKQLFHMAHDAGVEKFAVNVDKRNEPAIQLYKRMGFHEFKELRLPIVFQRLDQSP